MENANSDKTMTFYERIRAFQKISENGYPKTPVFNHSNYRLFEMIPAVPGASNNRGLTVKKKLILHAVDVCQNDATE